MSLYQSVAPDDIPVTVQEAKDHERIDINDDDILIENQLYASTRLAEQFTRRAFMPQTWIYQIQKIHPVIDIPRPRIIYDEMAHPVTVTFTDFNNTVTTIDTDDYFIDTTADPARLIFKRFGNFPYGFAGYGYGVLPWGYLSITYEAGYGEDNATAKANIPWEIKEGILQIFGFLYENREGQPMAYGSIAHELLYPFQVQKL